MKIETITNEISYMDWKKNEGNKNRSISEEIKSFLFWYYQKKKVLFNFILFAPFDSSIFLLFDWSNNGFDFFPLYHIHCRSNQLAIWGQLTYSSNCNRIKYNIANWQFSSGKLKAVKARGSEKNCNW